MKARGGGPETLDSRPVIGFTNIWSELTPSNRRLRDRADHVKRGVVMASRFPLEFPVTSFGEPLMWPITMMFRNLASMDVEETNRGNPIDGVILLAGCDKTTQVLVMDASLKRLGLDYVDLYQIHRYDPDTPIEETLQTLHEVVQAGKARYIGASSMYAWQFARMLHVSQAHGWARFVSMQNHYNLVYREEEREMLPLCRAEGVGIIPWSPLARGFLAGNRTRTEDTATMRAQTDDFAQSMYYRDNDFAVVDQLKQVAAARGVAPAQIALAWVLAQPGVTAPIIGASRIEQLNELGAALSIKLSEDECRTLQAVYQPHPVLGHS